MIMQLSLPEKQLLLNNLILEARDRMPPKMRIFEQPKRFKFAHGGRGGGKSESFAKILLKKADKKKLRILCTREIQNSIDESVYKLLKDLIIELHYTNYKILDNSIINLKTGSEFLFKGLWQEAKKQSLKSYANIDICWVEEAQAVSEESLKILIPTIRKKGSEIWFSFNRRMNEDPIFKLMNEKDDSEKIIVYINYYDNPYLPDELKKDADNCKRLSELRSDNNYNYIWLGLPEDQGDKVILSMVDVKNACKRQIEKKGDIEVGVDVARFGDDRTIIIKKQGLSMLEKKELRKSDLVNTFNELKMFINYDKKIKIKVDDTGLGGGLTDMLRADFYNVHPVNFGAVAKDESKYYNCISEMWAEIKAIIKEISIFDNIDLVNELTSRLYMYDNKGRFKVESKDDYKKRGFKSPDYADALLLAFYNTDIGSSFYNLGNRF